MKLPLAYSVTAFLATAASAQRAVIGYPADGTSVPAGSNITVEIDRPNSLSGSTEVAIVLGLQSCPSSHCIEPSDFLGSILYNGPYDPEYHTSAPAFKPPHQNFTVTIPSTTPTGIAQLGALHVSLIGAGRMPFLETLNITLNIV